MKKKIIFLILILIGIIGIIYINIPKKISLITVEFENGTDYTVQEFEINTSIEDIPIPEKENYKFVKWNTDIEILTENIKLDAVWEKSGFYVTYDATPGSFSDGDKTKTVFYEFDSIIKEGKFNIVYDNHKFKNWTLDNNKWNIDEYLKTKNSDVTVVAKYEKINAKIEYISNAESGKSESWYIIPNTKTVIKPCMFQNNGKVFKEWNNKPDGSGKTYEINSVVTANKNKDLVLYAQWTDTTSEKLTITNTTINDDVGRIDFKDGPKSDDGIYKLYIIDGDKKTLVQEIAACESGTFVFIGKNLTKLKFVIRAVINKKEVNISDEEYLLQIIDDVPISTDSARSEIKGVLPHPLNVKTQDFAELKVRQVAYNIYLSDLLKTTEPTIPFTYKGKTYHFNQELVVTYDDLLGFFKSNDYTITMIILNDDKNINPLIHANAIGSKAILYMLSTTASALEMEEAIGAFFGERYPQVKNWIVGNEIDAFYPWNYIRHNGIDEYINEYSKGFRAFYTGITKTNKEARIYIPLTATWNHENIRMGQYKGRDIIDLFAEKNKDLYWHLAYHPYNAPLIDKTAWDSTRTKQHIDTHSITMENIFVLTEYMQTKKMLNPDGSIKSIILSEFGYSSAGGNETNQAASLIFAYQQALKNEHIDAFLYTREVDEAEEIKDGLSVGLKNIDGSRKLAWHWYSAMGTDGQDEIFNKAKSIQNK